MITPGESCVFCAEKHLGIAEAVAALWPEIHDGTRQLAIGELTCAYHHLASGYPELAEDVESLIGRISSRATVTSSDIRSVREAVTSVVESTGSEDTSPGRLSGNFSPSGNDPKVGERLFCFAWRLAEECGYWKANKGIILGCLALAQPQLQKTCPHAADICRDLRHAVQLRSARQDDPRWKECAELLEQAITSGAVNG